MRRVVLHLDSMFAPLLSKANVAFGAMVRAFDKVVAPVAQLGTSLYRLYGEPRPCPVDVARRLGLPQASIDRIAAQDAAERLQDFDEQPRYTITPWRT